MQIRGWRWGRSKLLLKSTCIFRQIKINFFAFCVLNSMSTSLMRKVTVYYWVKVHTAQYMQQGTRIPKFV